LLRSGATPLTRVDDVLESFGIARPAPPAPTVAGAAAEVLAAVYDAPAGIDELTRRLGVTPAAVAAALTELELGGLVVEAEGVFRRQTPA
jgi:predicted Rossmann fold nucleotide-binding protein DprA/Smf involved in DNA uptake